MMIAAISQTAGLLMATFPGIACDTMEHVSESYAVQQTDKIGRGIFSDTIIAGETAAVYQRSDSIIVTENSPRRKNFVGRVMDYFLNADNHAGRKFDFGILPGPHFSSTVGLGLGVVATGLYSMDRSDSTLQRSNVTLYGDITTKGFMMVGLKGNNIFKRERYRLDYRLYMYTFPTQFWGIGYENGDNDDNEADYRRIKIDAMTRFMFKIAPKTFVGPLLNFQFVQGREVAPVDIPLFAGQDLTQHTLQAGLSFTYDSRDFILNACRGWFVQLDQTFAPRFLGNNYCFSATELTASTYSKVWRGGILAGEWHSRFAYGNLSWATMSEVGSSSRMRGYYEGRYRDKNIMEMQIELRQHVWKRNGVAVWIGGGQIFPEFSALRWKHILPCAGVGYRWEFKRRVNIRVDYGFTRKGGGFIL